MPTPHVSAPLPDSLGDVVAGARNVVAFTGAGMSADSGLDTFRDAQTGLWSNVDPQDMASIESWLRNPDPMWAWYLWRASLARRAQPNAGHRALAAWAGREGVRLQITTQNVDDLHERAGSTNVAHLHGSLYSYRCCRCDTPAPEPEMIDEPIAPTPPPSCTVCGHDVRPGVVWFGEALPMDQWNAAELAMQQAELVVIVGTSGVVQPAASLPLIAAEHGAQLLEISPQDTELTRFCDWSLRTTAALGLPALLQEMPD